MLGQVANLSRAEICRLGVDRGLMECPQEVGPQLIIQGKLPKGSLEMKIASVEPLGGKCDILMSVNSRLGMPWVHVEFDPATGFDPDTLWIFVKSKITTP